MLSLPLTEASAKIRTGPPIDDDEDYELNIWAGVLPLKLGHGDPLDDDRLNDGLVAPDNVRNYSRKPANK